MQHPDDYNKLIQRGDGIYTLMRPLSLAGVPFGRRMVILVQDGKLMLQSAFVPEPDLLNQISQLGEVTDIVVPTTFHDTFLNEVMLHYPGATYYCVPGAEKFTEKKVNTKPVSQLQDSPWADILQIIPIAGMPKVNEHAFYHLPSKSLLVSDLFFNIKGLDGWWLNTFAKLLGFADRPNSSRLFKAMVKDKVAFSNSLEEIAQLDFDQILTSHFNTVPTGGKKIINSILLT